ncbi:DUF5103 domain-containing protein [Aestuariibaculum sp. YM273]|uniref:type IX secretion system plug protein n=1 Tax=Aestuariibaculum sp. YM273 TaxID=3070659 RepID=UPI0027DD6300|nr:DUF5103 domain-containing protein [Aestuariibaculum sp. YM273]WMI64298.1 DUF5103 domain-containing protein [Aestuariibaculum sp. YM273]
MKINIQLLLYFFLFSLTGFAQVEEVAPPDYIKTINFKGNTPETQLPILKLGEYVILEFDALNGNEDDYYYKIEHFNHDWTPSVLFKSEYLNGFDNQRIRTYENSYNTYQIYSHYKLTIPNQFTKGLKVSGNYMLSIFNSYDELVFSRKFMIYEEDASVGVALKRARNIEYLDQKQRVDVTISPNGAAFNNPMQTVKIVIVQNNNLNTAIKDLKPLYTVGKQLIYKYDTETSFWGGNEYLYFENKDVRAANTGVQFIDLKELYHNYLFTNMPRYNRPYTYNPDINGNYVITNIDAEDPSIEADYVWVHFSLSADDTYRNKTVHVYGNFNNYVIDESTQLIYDENRDTFSTSLLLKQGFYNYKYVLVNDDNSVNEGAIGGNFYQTENNYKVIVYYRNLGARYDKIVGIGEGTSVNISN